MVAFQKIGVSRAAFAATAWIAGIGSAWAQADAQEPPIQPIDPEVVAAAARAAENARAAELCRRLGECQDAKLQVLLWLGILAIILILTGAVVILKLQRDTRKLVGQGNLGERYLALPFGVPEGTIRGFVSIFIIVMGIAVLIVQPLLDIHSTEAIVGFVSAVIAFYFVTRQQAQTTDALRQATTELRTTNETMLMSTTKSAFSPEWMAAGSEGAVLEAGSVSRGAINDVLYAETAIEFEPDDPRRFEPQRAIGKGGDGLTGYNAQPKWLRVSLAEIVARARSKSPLFPYRSAIVVSNDDYAKLAEAAAKGDGDNLVALLLKRITKCLSDAKIEVVDP